MDYYLNRVAIVQEKMREKAFDYLLLGPSSNMYYFSGLQTSPDERLQLLIIPAGGQPAAVLPEMYMELAKNSLGDSFLLSAWADDVDPFKLAKSRLVDNGGIRIAVDDTLRADHLIGLIKVLPGAKFEPSCILVDALRIFKDEKEIELMHEAGKLTDQVMARVQEEIHQGMSEKELVALIEFEMKRNNDIAFKPIVASGPNAAQPHHSPGNRRFEKGDFIIVDCGARYQGYCSDITRTFCLGKPTDEMKKVYDSVLEANTRAFEVLQNSSGLSGEEVDAAARAVITSAGYGPNFIHRLGHGIGLDVHEAPYLVEGNREPIGPGAAFTIEPGVYLAGHFGVRIEDVAVITGQGPRRLTAFPRELISLG